MFPVGVVAASGDAVGASGAVVSGVAMSPGVPVEADGLVLPVGPLPEPPGLVRVPDGVDGCGLVGVAVGVGGVDPDGGIVVVAGGGGAPPVEAVPDSDGGGRGGCGAGMSVGVAAGVAGLAGLSGGTRCTVPGSLEGTPGIGSTERGANGVAPMKLRTSTVVYATHRAAAP
ncbi:hypothetical protein V2W30_36505 [Streptomyces sp. Q6]|uniref:Uncharacterized protein n=1 Tax=Streptomyces citrinus TaxID=3118173 RepID=A0ACD5AM68_9ACTN